MTQALDIRAAHAATPNPRASGVAAWTATLLFVTNLVGYLDRSILTLLVAPVKASLHLSDGEIGLMLGAAFVLTFSVAGLLIGRLTDRLNRRNLLIVCVGIWSLSAAACGLAQSGAQLFVARMGVGVGEAAVYPIAVSLIADRFAPSRRGTPYGAFTMGVYAGGGLSLILTGAVLPWITTVSARLAAHGTHMEPWRLVMFLMLVPGALCCALLATLPEPVRTRDVAVADVASPPGLRDWLARAGVFLPHHLFMALVTLAMVGVTAWAPTVLIREHHLPTRTAGLLFGSLLAVTGVLSSALGGVLADRAGRRGGPAGALRMDLACIAVGCVGMLVLGTAHSTAILLTGFVIAFAPLSMSLIAGIIAMAELSPSRSRGQITSMYFLFTGVMGTAGGPALVGYLNDLAGGPTAGRLGTILGLTGAVATATASLIAWFTLTRVARLPATLAAKT